MKKAFDLGFRKHQIGNIFRHQKVFEKIKAFIEISPKKNTLTIKSVGKNSVAQIYRREKIVMFINIT